MEAVAVSPSRYHVSRLQLRIPLIGAERLARKFVLVLVSRRRNPCRWLSTPKYLASRCTGRPYTGSASAEGGGVLRGHCTSHRITRALARNQDYNNTRKTGWNRWGPRPNEAQ